LDEILREPPSATPSGHPNQDPPVTESSELKAIDLPLDVLWPRLIAIADEMATTLVRTAFTHDVI
jgi:hypothetical protein